MTVLIVRGDPVAFRGVFILMLVATLIDATDGFLARAACVKEVLPSFDGRQLDYLTDFLTYVVLPLLLVWRAEILPEGWDAWLLVPLLAGAYWFCQTQAKTDDGYFLGFPAYWNIVAFYLYVSHRQIAPLPGWLSLGVLLVFSVLTFVPSRYLYSTSRGRLNRVTNFLASMWVMLIVWIVYRLPSGEVSVTGGDPWWAQIVVLSLLFPVYYLVVSWYLSWSLWRRSRESSFNRDPSGSAGRCDPASLRDPALPDGSRLNESSAAAQYRAEGGTDR
jgi:phosphatidylcholine synthase